MFSISNEKSVLLNTISKEKFQPEGKEVVQNEQGDHQIGFGIASDLRVKLKYYQLAADQGDSDAQNFLGVCYQNGSGER